MSATVEGAGGGGSTITQRLVVSPLGMEMTPRAAGAGGAWAEAETSLIPMAQLECWELQQAGKAGGGKKAAKAQGRGLFAVRVVVGGERGVKAFEVALGPGGIVASEKEGPIRFANLV